MKIRNLVAAILGGDLLTARQWVADARREHLRWERLEMPQTLTDRELSVAAALVELLATRAGATPPAWTSGIGPVTGLLVLDPGLHAALLRARKNPRAGTAAQTQSHRAA